MSTLDREFLDHYLPEGVATRQYASIITGESYLTISPAEATHRGLNWLAYTCEQDWKGWGKKYEWQHPDHPDYDPTGSAWSMRFYGLRYKDKMSYLTNEGFGTGEPCWFADFEHGHFFHICAETQHLAVLRGIVVVHALAEQRKIPPKLRLDDCAAVIDVLFKNAKGLTDGSLKCPT